MISTRLVTFLSYLLIFISIRILIIISMTVIYQRTAPTTRQIAILHADKFYDVGIL